MSILSGPNKKLFDQQKIDSQSSTGKFEWKREVKVLINISYNKIN